MTEPSLLTSFDSDTYSEGYYSFIDKSRNIFDKVCIAKFANHELYNMWEENRKIIRKTRNYNHNQYLTIRSWNTLVVDHMDLKEIKGYAYSSTTGVIYNTLKRIDDKVAALLKSEDEIAFRMGLLLVLKTYIHEEDMSV